MKTSLDCIPCFVRQALEATRRVSPDDTRTFEIMRKILASISSFEDHLSPPGMAQTIHRIIREETGNSDPYKEVKDLSIAFALSIEEKVRNTILRSEDAFATALKFAISGNILDFAVLSTWDDNRIEASFQSAAEKELAVDEVPLIKEKISNASTILFLADNSGETVFDRLFIEQFPGTAQVYYAVKGGPIINDATYDCAVRSGLSDVTSILRNGSDAPGTLIDDCSLEFKQLFAGADVIIAKGQANYETLEDLEREIFFLLQIKCPVIGDNYGFSSGQWIGGRSLTYLKEQGLLSGFQKTDAKGDVCI